MTWQRLMFQTNHHPMAIVSLWQICRPSARRTKSNPAKISSDKFRVLLRGTTSGHQRCWEPHEVTKLKSQVKKHNKNSTELMLYPSGNGMIENVLNIFSGGDRSSYKHVSSKVKLRRLKRSCVGIHGIIWNVYCTAMSFHRPLLSTWLCVTCFVESVFAAFLKHLGVLTTQCCPSYSSSDVFFNSIGVGH